jgi:FkbM family methyltransferase
MYSQNNEEEVIVNFFYKNKNDGKFLDIGAYDGITLSNTYRLVELGWSGTCVEPSSVVFSKLLNTHKDNQKIKLVNAAITEKSELLRFYESNGDAIGTVVETHKDKWANSSGIKFRDVFIKTITMEELLSFSGYDFSFLNLDVEGLNLELVKMLPINKMKSLRLVCIEHDGNKDEIASYFGDRWKEILCNSENIILVDKTSVF